MTNSITINNSLLKGLINEFKALYQDNIEAELYKWELLQHAFNKNNLEIVDAVIKKSKNLVYSSNKTVLKELFKINPKGLDNTLTQLYDLSTDLKAKLSTYEHNMSNLCLLEWKNKAKDESEASVLLSCKYPNTYTFYMYKVYIALCQYLDIEPIKNAGERYPHFMKIIEEINELYGEELQETISSYTIKFKIRPTLLAVQTFIWIMFIEYPQTVKEIKNKLSKTINNKHQTYIDLLKANHNIIFNGAPGTGKTYLAKEIAEEMGAQYKMVQFHPSYDYTDFVEGLRPVKDSNGNIGFERKDGVFKEFCAEALTNLEKASKTIEVLRKEQSMSDRLDAFITDAIENEREMGTDRTKNKFTIIDQTEKNITISVPNNNKVKEVNVSKAEILKILLEKTTTLHSVSDIKEIFQRKYNTQQDSYIYVICTLLKKQPNDVQKVIVEQVKHQDYVFIIDEINRGEISKIFGELFFSIDPGYRGEKGKVQTQYQNLVEEGDVFKDGFYVPENVYIIGTMNDIDRSVESMDFAMRRRFAWQEITAEESAENMGITGELRGRMDSLNKVILETEGLGNSYQVGAAMFLKVKETEENVEGNCGMTVDSLWNLNLKSLMKEYLRGLPEADDALQKMEDAYFLKKKVGETDTKETSNQE